MAKTQMLSRQKMSLGCQLYYENGWLVGTGFASGAWIDVWAEREDRQLIERQAVCPLRR